MLRQSSEFNVEKYRCIFRSLYNSIQQIFIHVLQGSLYAASHGFWWIQWIEANIGLSTEIGKFYLTDVV